MFKGFQQQEMKMIKDNLAIKNIGMMRAQYFQDQPNNSKQMQQQKNFDLDQPLFQYNGNKEELTNWLMSPKTYTNRIKQNQVDTLTYKFNEEVKKLNYEINDVVEAINVYLKLFVITRLSIPPKYYEQNQLNQFVKNINNSKSDEELLMVITFEAFKQIRLKRLELSDKISIFVMMRLTIYIFYKFSFYSSLENIQDMEFKQQTIEEMIYFIYIFHTQKLLKKINNQRLHELYDKILTLAVKINFEPTLQQAIKNIAMLADIKQLNKPIYQRIKIHNSLFFRQSLNAIKADASRIDDYLLVFIVFKISVIDHFSYGCNLDSFWSHCEQRLLNKFDQFKLIQKKSLLYSLGKSLIQTESTLDLINKLLDVNKLNQERYEDNFLEYLANIILFGIARGLLNKNNMEILLPFIKEIMEDQKIQKQDKVKFISDTCGQIYRIGLYNDSYWYFFRYFQFQILSDKSSFFNILFISKTIPALEDEISNKALVEYCYKLYGKILNLPHYKDQIRITLQKATQVQQTLFEMRFGYFLNAFGRPYIKEKIIDDLFSADFYLENEKIIIEIEGDNHYVKQIDGTYKQNVITQFKRKYLQKLGYDIIDIGLPNVLQTPTQQSTTLREFQKQFNEIMKNKNKN